MEGSGSLFFKALSTPLAPIGIRTQVSGFKVPSDNHYTIGAWFLHGESNPDLSLERAASLPLDYAGMHGVGFEPTRFTTPGLKSGSLDHSDNRAFEQFRDLFRSVNYNGCCTHTTIYKQHTNL